MGDSHHYGFDPNSFGGSLMKDLLADLKLDDDDWDSLANLEKQLQDMESSAPESTLATPTAASLVVASHQPTTPLPVTTPPAVDPNGSLDAWSISLQKFASSSLEKDFLEANSARKEVERSQPRPPPGLAHLKEYDVNSTPAVPPGLSPPIPEEELVNQLASKLEHQLLGPPATANPAPASSTPPPTMQTQRRMPPMAPPTYGVVNAVVPPGYMPPHSQTRRGLASSPPPYKSMVPPTPVSTPQPSFGTLPQPQQKGPPLPAINPREPIQAWQQPPPQPPQPRIFANPHPAAPPVPAAGIAGRLMPARDICYVVHSILRPILSAEPKEFAEYHVQYWTRHHPAASTTNTPSSTRKQTSDDELASRQARAKLWSTERKVLGATSKQAVTRPRALIAAPKPKDTDEGADDDDRAALWQARLCCDRGWQTILSSPSPSSQHKLYRCLGVNGTTVDTTRLGLVLQLPKGRTLWARTLETYGIPAAAPSILPATLRILYSTMPTTGTTTPYSNQLQHATDRLWGAWAAAVRRRSEQSGEFWLDAIHVVMEYSPQPALQTRSSMVLVHALLEQAQQLAQQDPSFAERWKPTEEQFMRLL